MSPTPPVRPLRRRPLAAAAVALAAAAAAGAASAAPERLEIRVHGVAFDPLVDGTPGGPRTGPGEQLWLVQLPGPTRDAWLESVAASGLRILQYYPHHAYLAWGDAAAAAAAASLAPVRAVSPFPLALKPAPELAGRDGRIANVDVLIYDDGRLPATLAELEALGAEILQHHPAQPDGAFRDAIVRLDADAIDDAAALPAVLWLGYQSPRPTLDDEMSDQIVAGNYVSGEPLVGYASWLAEIGLDGDGVTWAVVDTGVDWDHPDLAGRLVGGYTFPDACSEVGEPGTDCAGGGHGTHVAGIVGGDATAGLTDGDGFLYGLGVAPGAGLFAMNSLSGVDWPPAGGWQEHSKRAVLGGALGGNNSWTSGEGTAHGYQATERTHDFMVRDGNFDTPGVAEPFIEVFSAGNSGSACGDPNCLTSPKEAKNLIVVASSLNFRIGDIDTISSSSSRGPALDGRWVPTVAAPGGQIASTRNDLGGSCASPIPGTGNLYAFCSGTSMAAPHVSGAIAVAAEWWRGRGGGADPSPALARALLVNTAVDMPGAQTGPIPNRHEGWGRIHLAGLLQAPVAFEIRDQADPFAASGASASFELAVQNLTRPLKVTLAWTDAPGAVGADPALVNDLDLVVVHDGATYRGNVFSDGWSIPDGPPDRRNNLENVYLESPATRAVTVTVNAFNIAGDGVPANGDPTDQDFVLVCQNCIPGLFADGFEAGDTSAWDELVSD